MGRMSDYDIRPISNVQDNNDKCKTSERSSSLDTCCRHQAYPLLVNFVKLPIKS